MSSPCSFCAGLHRSLSMGAGGDTHFGPNPNSCAMGWRARVRSGWGAQEVQRREEREGQGMKVTFQLLPTPIKPHLELIACLSICLPFAAVLFAVLCPLQPFSLPVAPAAVLFGLLSSRPPVAGSHVAVVDVREQPSLSLINIDFAFQERKLVVVGPGKKAGGTGGSRGGDACNVRGKKRGVR